MRHVLQKWKLTCPNRNISARLLQKMKVQSFETTKFCETSILFEVDNIKKETSLRDFLQNEKLTAELMASCQCVLRFFHSITKVLRLPRKSEARSNEVLHLSRKIILAKLKIWCSKMQLVSGNQRPDLRISLIEMSLAFWPYKANKPWTKAVSRDYLLAHLDVFSPESFSSDSFSSDSFSSLTALTTVATSVHKSEVLLLSFLRL